MKTVLAAGTGDARTVPTGLISPRSGSIRFQNRTFRVIVDLDREGKPKLFFDSKGNGEFTGDGPVSLETTSYSFRKEAAPFALYRGFTTVRLVLAGRAVDASVGVYLFDQRSSETAALRNSVFFYADFAETGRVKLGGKQFGLLLCDPEARVDSDRSTRTQLMIDVAGSGRYDLPEDRVPTARAFRLNGETVQLSAASLVWGTCDLKASAGPATEIVLPVHVGKGSIAPRFLARSLRGGPILFPAGFHRRLVLLDFWATWCAPCMAEMPNVCRAYRTYGSKGLDVVGVSLDDASTASRIDSVARRTHMDWDQICEPHPTRIAALYGVKLIPHAFLVDVATGAVVAEGEELRGKGLDAVLERELGQRPRPVAGNAQ